jgi:hypothetical protein
MLAYSCQLGWIWVDPNNATAKLCVILPFIVPCNWIYFLDNILARARLNAVTIGCQGTWTKRGGNFRQKNSAEDGIDGTIGLFRRNSGCSAEQISLGIPFQTIPWKRKMLKILCSATEIEAISRNSVPNRSVEEKNAQNSVPCIKNRSKLSEFRSEPISRKRKQLGK